MASTSASDGYPSSGLFWGVKQSFMRYLSMLDDADIALSENVELVEGALLCFALDRADIDPETGTGSLRFSGTAVLSGHGGLMRVQLRDPCVRLRPEGADLTVGDPSSAPSGDLSGDPSGDPSGGAGRLTLAELGDAAFERSGTDVLWSALQVRLSAAGVPLFGGQYAPGQPLDPVYVRIPLD